MNKGKVVRLAGFVGALGLSTVLVTTAIQGTGAYFQDSTGSNITASSGHLKLLTQDESQNAFHDQDTFQDMAFTNLWPGDRPSHSVKYKSDSSGTVDVWMVFTPTDPGYLALTGAKSGIKDGTAAGDFGGGLGRYGFIQVDDSSSGTVFVSGNLAFPATGNGTSGNPYVPENNTWPAANSCHVDPATGIGGSSVESDGTSIPPWCGVPAKILIRQNLNDTDGGTLKVTFGFNGPLLTDQTPAQSQSVPFKLVAVQHGQQP